MQLSRHVDRAGLIFAVQDGGRDADRFGGSDNVGYLVVGRPQHDHLGAGVRDADDGAQEIRAVDVTTDYLTTTRAWLAARLRHRETVRPLDPTMFDGRVDKGGAAIEDGLLHRTLYSARVP